MTTIQLGFEVGSGTAVTIPLKHMAVTGMTQEAGKTTTLEALITRSELRALTFITKRGEGAFASARTIPPYFREQADWQFVASILEASRGEKLKIERAWIIRASKGARTLADVHANVKKSMADPKIRGMSADMYLTLDAYLEVVVPAIGSVRWASKVELAPGVNVMDLTGVPSEMQHLVIKSSIDWILQFEHKTVVVVPEAWKFIPQGRGTPVKRSADAYIRQGAALGNYLWLDSQDLGGIEKEILRNVAVWLLGVQREANEIKRTLSNIPATVAKPSAADIATLELGQFFACWGKHAIRTYVQPAWMNVATAQAIARGEGAATDARVQAIAPRPRRAKEYIVTKDEADKLTRENERLKEEVHTLTDANAEAAFEMGRLRRRLEALEKGQHDSVRAEAQRTRPARPQTDDAHAVTGARRAATPPTSATASNGHVDEATYQAILARLRNEAPSIIRVLATRPEMEVTVTRKTLQLDEYSLKGRIARLLREGFFSDAKGPSSVRAALKRTGPDANTANIGRALDDLTRDGFVTDEGSGYREVGGMKVNIIEA